MVNQLFQATTFTFRNRPFNTFLVNPMIGLTKKVAEYRSLCVALRNTVCQRKIDTLTCLEVDERDAHVLRVGVRVSVLLWCSGAGS